MRSEQPPEDDNLLNQTLNAWRVDTSLPPRFQEHVWSRIARAEANPRMTFWARLHRFLDATLARPTFACSYVAILLLAGILAGSLAAQRHVSRLDAALGSRYVQTIDPYQKTIVNP